MRVAYISEEPPPGDELRQRVQAAAPAPARAPPPNAARLLMARQMRETHRRRNRWTAMRRTRDAVRAWSTPPALSSPLSGPALAPALSPALDSPHTNLNDSDWDVDRSVR